jgi:hypothetical protein
MRAELTRFNLNTAIAHPRDEVLVEPTSLLRRRSTDKRRTALACIGVERELRDYQDGAFHRADRAIHLARRVGENSHPDDPIDKKVRIGFTVAPAYADQQDEAASNGARRAIPDSHLGPANPLNNRAHECVVSQKSQISQDTRPSAARALIEGSIVLKTP